MSPENPPKPGQWQQPQELSFEEKQRLEIRRKELDAMWKKPPQKLEKPIANTGTAQVENKQEKIAEIVLKDGGVRVHISVPGNLSPRGNSGFQNLETRIQDGRQPWVTIGAIEASFVSSEETQRGQRLDGVLRERGIKEVIDIRYDKRPKYESITIPGKKGVLGVGKTPDRIEQRATGQYEAVLHSDIVNGGKREPAVRFAYYVSSPDWRDYSGRTGQMMLAEIVLPESVAKEVELAITDNPKIIRNIIERVMKEKLLKNPEAWEKPDHTEADALRPPYERWEKEPNGGRIYIQKRNQ